MSYILFSFDDDDFEDFIPRMDSDDIVIRKRNVERWRTQGHPDCKEGNVFTPHCHKCPNKTCGYVWHHDPAEMSESEYEKSHDCPKCGTHNSWVYEGELIPNEPI